MQGLTQFELAFPITVMARRLVTVIVFIAVTFLLAGCSASGLNRFNYQRPFENRPVEINDQNNLAICETALDPQYSLPKWDPRFLRHVREAERRGLTPKSCIDLVGGTKQSDFTDIVRTENDINICYASLDISSTVPQWRGAQVYIDEAERRGFNPETCANLIRNKQSPLAKRREKQLETIDPSPIVNSEPDGYDPNLVRRIQYGLAKLGFKPGPADGVTGDNTRSAIKEFEGLVSLPVTGEPSEKLLAAIQATIGLIARAKQTQRKKKPKLAGGGTGFAISANNLFLTNNHVIEGCTEVRIQSQKVRIEAFDQESDLALLKAPGNTKDFARFRGGRGIRSGESVVVMGFPLQEILSNDLNVTIGNVSSLAGIRGNRQYIQITAPVQPGNSGGPLLDASGNVVGVVASRLDALRLAAVTGSLPQNVNFAISQGTVRAFLDAHNVAYELKASLEKTGTADMVAQAQKYVKLIECWK